MEIQIDNPILVYRSGSKYIIVALGSDLNSNPMAQVWSLDSGYSDVRPLQVWLKFLYYIDVVTPPVPWIKPEQDE